MPCTEELLFRFLTDNCRILKFKPAMKGYSLQGHMIKSFNVQRESACEARCFMEHNCVTFNVGPSRDEDGTYICELSDSDHKIHPEALVRQNGFTYKPTEVSLIVVAKNCTHLVQAKFHYPNL